MTDFTYTWNSPAPKFTRKRDGNGEDDIDRHVSSWAKDSVKYGNAAGVDPRLVLAIVYNEGADTPQELRAGYEYGRWLENFTTDKPNGNSLGLTNIKEPAFNKLKERYPAEFGRHEWSDLMADQHLAIKATAYTLKRLQEKLSPKIPSAMKARYSLNEILAAGYNAEEFFDLTDGYLAKGALGDHASAYVLKAMTSFHRAESVLAKLYTWQDKVDPGMPNNNPLVDPSDPHTHIVDIPPPGGYPSNKAGTISAPIGLPVLPGIGPVPMPDSPQLEQAISASPWLAALGGGSAPNQKAPLWIDSLLAAARPIAIPITIATPTPVRQIPWRVRLFGRKRADESLTVNISNPHADSFDGIGGEMAVVRALGAHIR
ncbi:hypothetical protein [Nocardia gipuzkoensis]|uniref:hypothetical protein n=1 Tax=Nocardia gipuzkoensis TaxID=2749991 RepID=UPI003EDF12CC